MVIAHAYIEVAELERGIEFYCNGLGLSLRRRLSPKWVELEGANMADPFGNGFDLIEFSRSGYDAVSR